MSKILRYEKNQIPFRPVGITIVEEDTGVAMNLVPYDSIEVELIGSDNEKVDTTGLLINTQGRGSGQLFINWPVGRSLFTKRGTYLMRFKFTGTGKNDFSDTVEIRVSDFGRNK